jgi:apolipoprotein N-acyltransferase
LPRPVQPTLYVRAGDSVAAVLVAAAAVLVLRRRLRRKPGRSL